MQKPKRVHPMSNQSNTTTTPRNKKQNEARLMPPRHLPSNRVEIKTTGMADNLENVLQNGPYTCSDFYPRVQLYPFQDEQDILNEKRCMMAESVTNSIATPLREAFTGDKTESELILSVRVFVAFDNNKNNNEEDNNKRKRRGILSAVTSPFARRRSLKVPREDKISKVTVKYSLLSRVTGDVAISKQLTMFCSGERGTSSEAPTIVKKEAESLCLDLLNLLAPFFVESSSRVSAWRQAITILFEDDEEECGDDLDGDDGGGNLLLPYQYAGRKTQRSIVCNFKQRSTLDFNYQYQEKANNS